MHPFFSRPKQLLFYLGSWLGLAVLTSFAVSYPDESFQSAARIIVPVALIFSFVSLSSWALCRSLPLRETHPVRLGILVVAGGVVAGWLFQGIVIGWMWIIGDITTGSPWAFRGAPLLIFTTGVVLYILSVVFHYLLLAYETSHEAERRSLEAQILARSSELKALRAQIDPHFLFNALNSITALIPSDPERARTMTVQLAEFFRTSVAAGRQQLYPLAEELRLVGMFLDIEAVRHGNRLTVSLSHDDDTADVLVPPLILQPLVENAIKHGIAHLVDGGTITITSRRNGTTLTVSVRNPVDPDSGTALSAGTGFGLQAVRDRLRTIAPGRGYLDTGLINGSFEATINLPTDLQ